MIRTNRHDSWSLTGMTNANHAQGLRPARRFRRAANAASVRCLLAMAGLLWLAACAPEVPPAREPDVRVYVPGRASPAPAALEPAPRRRSLTESLRLLAQPGAARRLPRLTAAVVSSGESAVIYSYNLLRAEGLEPSSEGGRPLFAPVEFPGGEPGGFVAIGYWGPSRGYQFLYRSRGAQVEMVGPIVSGEYAWGLFGTARERDETRIRLEPVTLFADQRGTLLQVRGAGRGLNEASQTVVEWVAVTEQGLQVVLRAAEAGDDAGRYVCRPLFALFEHGDTSQDSIGAPELRRMQRRLESNCH